MPTHDHPAVDQSRDVDATSSGADANAALPGRGFRWGWLAVILLLAAMLGTPYVIAAWVVASG